MIATYSLRWRKYFYKLLEFEIAGKNKRLQDENNMTVQNEMNGFGQNISSLEMILSIIQNVEKSYQINYSAFDSDNVDEDEYEGNNDNGNNVNYKPYQ